MKIPWYLATQTQGRQLVICRVHFTPALRRLPHLVFCQGGLPIVFGFEKPNSKSAVTYELFWQLRFAMSQSRHRACGYLVAVAGATWLPPPRSDDSELFALARHQQYHEPVHYVACLISSNVSPVPNVLLANGSIRPVKNWTLGCWWWWSDWSFARLIAPVVTTTSIILSSNTTG